jgi:hypothetical protein
MTRSPVQARGLETNVSMRGCAIVVPPGGIGLKR